MENCYFYISTRACYDPVKTIIVFAPSEIATDLASAERFAVASGWQAAVEDDGAVLLVPIASESIAGRSSSHSKGGWEKQPLDLPETLYLAARSEAGTRNGKSIYGRNGMLWLWETMIYLAGYEDGATFAGNCLVANPDHFAAAALIGGGPDRYDCGQEISGHWLVREVSDGYHLRKNQIPSSLWLWNPPEETREKVLEYFSVADGLGETPSRVTLGGVEAECYANPQDPACRILISKTYQPICMDRRGRSSDDSGAAEIISNEKMSGFALARTILREYFDRSVRWKNGPDGELRLHKNRQDFYTDPEFVHTSVTVNFQDYPCAVHFPRGVSKEQAAGLPLVFSIHGRGEPAWLFAQKNGWDLLADETKAFVLAVPDSPGNIWSFQRDGKMFAVLVDKLCGEYGLDRERVYLTGFSNGASITREAGSAYPELFAAIAPSNGPVHVSGLVQEEPLCPTLLPSGYELPYWLTVGDCDPVTKGTDLDEQLKVVLEANRCLENHRNADVGRKNAVSEKHCQERSGKVEYSRFTPDEVHTGENWYTRDYGYLQGHRFYTMIFHGPEGTPRVGCTVMKDMPHGSICEQSRAAWEFMKHFRRPGNGKNVLYME